MPLLNRRSFVIGTTAFLSSAAVAGGGSNPGYPTRIVRLVVPYPPGGPLDAVARVVGEALGNRFGQPFVIENKSGASGIIGTDSVAKAKPDGHTLLFTISDTQVNNAVLFKQLPYNPRRDFTGVSQVVAAPAVLVIRGDLPVSTMPQLIAYLGERRGTVTYGSWSLGGLGHLVTESLNRQHNLQMAHSAYRGENPLVNDLLGRQITLGMASIANTKQHGETGALKLIAVTGLERAQALPDVPTLRELGYQEPIYGLGIWLGVLAPVGTPRSVVERLAHNIAEIVRSQPIASIIRSRSFEPIGLAAEAFDALIGEDIDVVGKAAKDLEISLG